MDDVIGDVDYDVDVKVMTLFTTTTMKMTMPIAEYPVNNLVDELRAELPSSSELTMVQNSPMLRHLLLHFPSSIKIWFKTA